MKTLIHSPLDSVTLKIGLNVFVEFTIPEGLDVIEKRQNKLSTKLRSLKDKEQKIRDNIIDMREGIS